MNTWRVVADQIAESERECGTDQLGRPVTNHVGAAELPTQEGSEGDSRVMSLTGRVIGEMVSTV